MRLRHMIFVTTALVSVAGTAHAQDVTAAAQSSSATTAGSSDDIVVTGYRKSLQDAIAIKRRADSIVDVISAEDVGKLPDSNVA
ncbi:hypothetical protein ACNJG8_21125, partial [Mycobacterium tuberculosis]